MNTALASLLVLLVIATPVAAREASFVGDDQSSPFSHPAQREFLPAREAFRASAWRDDQRLHVGFIIAEDYYLHRHQFALESRNPAVSLGELALPPGVPMVHASLGEIEVFYDRVVVSAPIEALEITAESLAITVTFQGCSDRGLCYPPERVELGALYGSPPAAFDSPLRDTGDSETGAV